MEKEIQYKLSLRILKDNGIYQKWRNNVLKTDSLYNTAWFKNEDNNSGSMSNIIWYGFPWSQAIEGSLFWKKQNDLLVETLTTIKQHLLE